MTIDLAQKQLSSPQQQHGIYAVARLPYVQANDVAHLDAEAQKLSFQSVGPGAYVHQDGSWVAAVGGRIERGVFDVQFRGVARDVRQIPLGGAGTMPKHHAARAVLDLPQHDLAAFTASLVQHGFVEISSTPSSKYFSHPDASWVALVDGAPVIGVGSFRVQRETFFEPFEPGRAYHELPSLTWDWWRNDPRIQIGQLPILSNAPWARDELKNRGFVQGPDMNGNERWDHPTCGTWVEFPRNGRGPILGWHKWHLGQLPFNNRIAGY